MLASFRRSQVGLVVFMLAIVALLGSSVALATGCTPRDPIVPSNYSPTSCADACTHARSLCGPATLKPKTGTCEDVCRVTEEGGGDFRTGCLSAAASCAEVETCSR